MARCNTVLSFVNKSIRFGSLFCVSQQLTQAEHMVLELFPQKITELNRAIEVSRMHVVLMNGVPVICIICSI